MQTGSISHGTLREEDLVPTFLRVIRAEHSRKADAIEQIYADAIEHLKQGLEPNPDDIQDLMESLYDALDDLAPEGYRFGAHEGDGSDFGFWEIDTRTDIDCGHCERPEDRCSDESDRCCWAHP